MTKTPLQPGVATMLERLHGKVTMAIATSKPRVLAMPILDALHVTPLFREIAGPDLDAPNERKAETLERALANLEETTGVPVQRAATVMVGDREHDIVAAPAARVFGIGVTWGSGSRDELVAAMPGAIFDRPEDLTAAILGERIAPL